MIAWISKNLTGLFPKNASCVRKSHASCFLSLNFSSTSSKEQRLTNLRVLDLLLHKHQFSPKVASKVASVLTQIKDPKNADSILLFLKESGFSATQLEKILNYRPQVLSASIDATIKPKIRTFQDLGFSSNDIAKIISSYTRLLGVNLNTRAIPALSVLKELLGSNDDVSKLLRKSGWFLTTDLEKTMLPNIELMKSCGISMERIMKFLFNYPRGFLLRPEIMREYIAKAEEMGADRRSNLFIYAIRIVASLSSKKLELKLQAFQNLGFSDGDIMTMFRKGPQVFAGSIEKIEKTTEFLLATGKYKLSCIANNPVSLSSSLEKKFKPRLQILGILENKNLIKNWPNLGTIYPMSDEKFFQKFVCPYLDEVVEVHILWNSVRGKKEKKNDPHKELG